MKDIEILLIIGGIFFIIGLYKQIKDYKEQNEYDKGFSKTAFGILLFSGFIGSGIGYFMDDDPNLNFYLLLSVAGLILEPVLFGVGITLFNLVVVIKRIFKFLLKSGAYIVVYTFRGLHKLKEESEKYIEKNK